MRATAFAWDEIEFETVRKCFGKVEMYPKKSGDDDDDDQLDGKESMNLNEQCSKL